MKSVAGKSSKTSCGQKYNHICYGMPPFHATCCYVISCHIMRPWLVESHVLYIAILSFWGTPCSIHIIPRHMIILCESEHEFRVSHISNLALSLLTTTFCILQTSIFRNSTTDTWNMKMSSQTQA